MPTLLVAIAAGGSIGAVARYGVAAWFATRLGTAFPWATLTVNVAGSMLLGVLLPLLEPHAHLTSLRAFVTVGCLGAFTTFSTFAYDALALIRSACYGRAALYILASTALTLLGVAAGLRLAAAMS